MCISLIVCKGKSISNFSCEKFLITFDNVWKKFGIKKETRFYYTWDISTSFFFAENDLSRVASLCDIFIEFSWQDFFFLPTVENSRRSYSIILSNVAQNSRCNSRWILRDLRMEYFLRNGRWFSITVYLRFFSFFFFFLINCQAKF